MDDVTAHEDEHQELREEVRAFLAEHMPAPDDVPVDFDAYVEFLRGWQRRLHEARLVGLTWPADYGGRGAPQAEQIVVNEEFARAEAPRVIGFMGLDVLGPSIVEYGTDEQRARYLEPILSARELWCQGFSEPGSGSDLASLRTRAVDAGDHFVLDGQKIWTSFATHARWCSVLARTDPDAPPHKGISYLIVDLRSPGIEVRPLVQVTGDPEFTEVFFDQVEVSKENLLGPLHGGWQMAMHTLAHERGPAALATQVQLRVRLERLIREAALVPRFGRPAIEAPEIRTALARAHIAVEGLRCQTSRSSAIATARGVPGLESSVDKVASAAAEQLVMAAAMDVLGAYATHGDGADWGISTARWQHGYFYGRASSVYGGSLQIQRNILAERVLGLPRSAR
jgi:alkylation response protein AidB-like acyl-CoA dehydrogenase